MHWLRSIGRFGNASDPLEPSSTSHVAGAHSYHKPNPDAGGINIAIRTNHGGSHGLMKFPYTGCFVHTFDKFGIGKLMGSEGDHFTVRFFKAADDFVVRRYTAGQLERAYLSPQTRGYFCDEYGVWTVGRVIDYLRERNGIYYLLRFPNDVERKIPETDLEVRCMLPIDDPCAILSAGGIETQFFHDRRKAVLECLSKSRATSYGLTGLLSSSIELLPHQIDVVRRVMGDPVQRYLLADEVGLGKTIEACSIVRQAMLDNPGERVFIFAPTSLISQWGRELETRFFIEPSQHRLHVMSYEQLETIDPSEVDTLIIDEAHNLIPVEPASDAGYKSIKCLASQARRLLLISATPVLGNETILLGLLHLLDPENYQLEHEEIFHRKVQYRQEFGRLLLAINASQRPGFLRLALKRLRELIPSDKLVERMMASVEKAVVSGQSDIVNREISALHRHVGDTYRLHQRLIRTRRRDLAEGVLPPRESVLYTLEEDDDDRTPILVDTLDQWRQRSLEALEVLPDSAQKRFESNMAGRYARLHEALGISVEECAGELQVQLNELQKTGEGSFDRDAETLALALRQVDKQTEDTRIGFAKRVVEGALRQLNRRIGRPRLVVFGTSTEFVRDLRNELVSDRSLETDIFLVVKSSDEKEVLNAVEGFRRALYSSVLICDRRGEEGLNLQFAHGIVHLDLPLQPARIEQRIGRLDRLGRKVNQAQAIHHWVIAPYYRDFHPWEAWYELLRDGFRVFEESISEVQFLLDELQQNAQLALYRKGAEGLRELGSEVKQAVRRERERLDEQYALDSRIISSTTVGDDFGTIEELDEAQHYDPIHRWLTRVLKFSLERLEDVPSAFRLHWTARTLLAKEPWQELIRDEYLSQPMTYVRTEAVNRINLRLVRPGLNLLDAIERLLRWDDRGIAFATWRSDARWTGEGRGIWLGFRLTYVIQADDEKAREALEGSFDVAVTSFSLRRRMDSLLPPWTVTVDVDIGLKPLTDPLLKEILALPYSTDSDYCQHRDYNLGSRREALYGTISFRELSEACQKAKAESEDLLRNSPDFLKWIDLEQHRAINRLESDTDRLKRRFEAISSETGRSDRGLERDIHVNEAILSALDSPSVRLDSIGLFIVSNSSPEPS